MDTSKRERRTFITLNAESPESDSVALSRSGYLASAIMIS
jgi:hypothetical protein